MKHTEWETTAQTLNLLDDKTLLSSYFNDISIIDVTSIIIDFLGNVSLPNDFAIQANKCTLDITDICKNISNQLSPTNDDLSITQLFGYLSHARLFSNALDDIFANIAQNNPQPLPTPATRQKTLELITLYFVMKHFASWFYKQNKPFYALSLANKALEMLGGAKYFYGLSQNTILKTTILSDDDKQAIYKQEQQEQGRQHALKATEHKRQEKLRLTKKYLAIMDNKGFTSCAQTAEYIFIHENQENRSFDWILKALRNANKK